jgi:RNA polymerase sigma factor (sigma-70 family)
MYIKDEHQAEEVMLDGFFTVFTQISGFKNQGSFEGWIRKIMIRKCIDFLRKNSKVVFQEDSKVKTPEYNEMHYKYETLHIQHAIDQLPEGYKMIFNLYAIEGYKHDEIATMLNISQGTSKSQLHKARKMLQDKLKDYKPKAHGDK